MNTGHQPRLISASQLNFYSHILNNYFESAGLLLAASFESSTATKHKGSTVTHKISLQPAISLEGAHKCTLDNAL